MTKQDLRIVGAHEIRKRLGKVSRQRVYQLTARADFPAPVANLMQGKVWLASDVEQWINRHRMRPEVQRQIQAQPKGRTVALQQPDIVLSTEVYTACG